MAIEKLKTDYVNSVTEQYKYKLTDVGIDEKMMEDVSEYSEDGSYFGAYEINTTNKTVNQIIDAIKNADASFDNLKRGTIIVERTHGAEKVKRADTADKAIRVSTSNTSDYAENVQTAETSLESATTSVISGAKINDVLFDGSGDITVFDDTKISTDDRFILQKKKALTFENNICKITNARITSDSLVEVAFTSSCIDSAYKAIISVESYKGYVLIKAGRTPSQTLTATIYVRVI